jgi:membrane protein implicated in regulation of membrane protease activity
VRPGAATWIFALFGVVLLALIGGLGVYLYLTTGARGDTLVSALMQLLKIYTPWQIAFAYVLAKVLRPDG